MCYNIDTVKERQVHKMTNTELNELITILRTPIDFAPLRAKADAIQADLNRIGSELNKLDNDLEGIKANCEKIEVRLIAGPCGC